MSLPVFKLGLLAVKQVSKPIAKSIKDISTDNKTFARICIYTGRLIDARSTRINLSYKGHKIKKVKEIPEDQALKAGAEFISELFVYSVSAGAIILEYARRDYDNEKKALAKEERTKAKAQRLETKFNSLEQKINSIQAENERLRLLLLNHAVQTSKTNKVITQPLINDTAGKNTKANSVLEQRLAVADIFDRLFTN